ncbi:SNF2 family N-terminal domain-containing protein [Leptodontidium sp. 2 PMI_412]|nr:SNF2 family N-terminal domain-containing protein [Leptodontidium sp. 2 PMI_412]
MAGLESTSHIEIKLQFEGNAILLRPLIHDAADEFAVVNEETTKVLKTLSSLESCFLKAFVPAEAATLCYKSIGNIHQNVVVPIDIVVYGQTAIRQSVDHILSSSRLYLQHPCSQERNTLYDNPHFLKEEDMVSTSGRSLHLDKFDTSKDDDSEVDVLLPTEEEIDGSLNSSMRALPKIARVFNSLTRFKSLKRLEADAKITTPLNQHQEEALDFMSQRESDSISEDYSLWTKLKEGEQNFFEHKITGHRTERPPKENIGGILADEMGLGKTLTTLATIIRSSEASMSFAASRDQSLHLGIGNPSDSIVNSRATFVIVPSSTIIDVWVKEVNMRCAGSLVVNIYHGRGRAVDPRSLANSDIVLSTYHTVAAEAMDIESPLKSIVWFRIVLDEAHTIRQMKTKLYQSVSKLSAQYRWCLTGTPIQNGLEDLASLVCFIRSPNLNSVTEFRKHILYPMAKGTREGVQNLRMLLDSICLRRTNRLLSLPRVVRKDRFVNFSPTERELYIKTQSDMIAAIKQHDSRDRNSKDYFGVFQLQLQLRRLCNHGTFQKSVAGTSPEDLRFDQRQLFSLLPDTGMRACLMCKDLIKAVGSSKISGSGSFTPCGHLLCLGCFPQYTAEALKVSRTSDRCPLCKAKLGSQYAETQWIESPEPSAALSFCKENIDRNCTSSKIEALVREIRSSPNEGKSIVFSCWTRSLDLTAHFLAMAQVKFLRIDGNCTMSQRQKILDDFDVESEIRILLMTTGTGAIGLNLTIANRVFILEPQWNPMVETQAIGRVLRMGQGRSVKIVRFMVKGTIEEV